MGGEAQEESLTQQAVEKNTRGTTMVRKAAVKANEDQAVESGLKAVAIGDARNLVYCYGARLDKEAAAEVDDQVRKARTLYNDVIAMMRSIYDEMQAFVLSSAPQEVRDLHAEVERLSKAFEEARASQDGEGMKKTAQERKGV